MNDRFMAKVRKEPGGCWIWTACVNDKGYGHFRYGGRIASAHRVAYEMFVGPIPDGLVIDHLCRNPPCVNPDHLEAVTFRTNVVRGIGPTAINSRKTSCNAGHALSEVNTYLAPDGRRQCRSCNREAVRRYAARKKVPA
jgi:HNH endonuclease